MPWGKLGTIWSELGLDTSPLAQGVARSKALMDEADRALSAKAKAISKSLGDIGKTLSLQVTAPLSLMGGMAAKTAMEFETAMANVWTIVDAGKDTIAAMGKEVEALSFELPQTAKQLADGLYQVISAAIPAQDAMGVLEVSARAAAAGLSDTFTAVDAVTSVLNAYGMEAERAGIVSDIMFKTVERGKVTFPELAQNLGDVVSTAATAGVSFEELGGALATLTKVGVRAPEAVTALNQAILTFIDPSDEAAKLAKQLGIEFNATSLATKGLYGVLQDVQKATDGNIEMLSALFPNVRALKGVLGLLRQDMGLFRDDLDAMRTSLGATDKAFEKQAQTGAHAMQLFKNQVSALARAFGDEIIPMLVSMMEKVEPVIQAFRDLPTPMKQTIVQFGLLAAAAGPVMLALSGIIGLLSGPAGIVVGAIAAAGAIVGLARYLGDLQGRAERTAKAAEAHANALKDERTRAEELIGKIQALTNEKEALRWKTEITKDEEKRLAEIQGEIKRLSNELASIIPTVAAAYDAEGNAVVDLNTALKELARLRREEYAERAKAAEAYVVAARARVEEAEDALRRLDEAYKAFREGGEAQDPWTQAYRQRSETYTSEEARAKLDQKYNEMKRKLLADLQAAQRDLYLMTQRYRAVGMTAATGREPSVTPTGTRQPPPVVTPPPGTTTAPTEPSAWELWLEKVRKLSKESYGVLKEAFEGIAENLESGDIALRTEAEQKMSAILSFLGKAVMEYGAEWEKKIAPALSQFVKRGYKEAEKGATELGKALESFRHKVIVEGLSPEAQLEYLKSIEGVYKGTEDEVKQLTERIAQLTEQVRERQVRSAYDQYQFEAQLYDFKARDHMAYINRLLQLDSLSDEDRKKLTQDHMLWEKRAREEDIEAERKANEAEKALRAQWNEYMVSSGRKARREVLAEAVKAAEDELYAALATGKGIAEADLRLQQARHALREQEKKDARDEYTFLVQMGALTTRERIAQVRTWLAEEQENSAEFRKLKVEELELLRQFHKEEAQALVKRLGPIDKASLDQLREWQAGLGKAYKDAVALGQEGADAAEIYLATLGQVAEAIDRLTEKQAKELAVEKQARYERGLLSAEDYIAYLKEQRDAFREFSEDWIRIDNEITRVMEKEAEKRKKFHEDIAKATVARMGPIDKASLEQLQEWRVGLAQAYEEARTMGEQGAGAADIYREALIDVVTAIDKLTGKQLELIDAEKQWLYNRGKLLAQDYLAYLRDQQAAVERYSAKWLQLDEEIERVLKNEADKRKKANEEIARSVVARMSIEEASLDQLMAWQLGLGQAYKDAIAQGEEGTDAAKIYLQTLEQVVRAIKQLTKEQADVLDNEKRWRYERGLLSAKEYIDYLNERLSKTKEFSDEWVQIQAEIARVEEDQADKRKKDADEAVARQLKQADTVAEGNLLAAIEMLKVWREAYAAMGKAYEDAVKKIDAKLLEFIARHKEAAGEVQAFLEKEEKGDLASRLKLLDEEFKAKAAAGVNLVQLNKWYQDQLKEITEKETAGRIKSIDRMNEEEVAAAQKTLDEILALIQERVGQESKAADVIAAIQAELNARLIALADEGEEKQREARQKSIDETVRALQQSMEFRKTTGTLPWRDELTYLELIADLDSDTREARMEGATRYYGAVRQMIQDMSEEELAALKTVLEASLVTYQAMGEKGEEMAAAIMAALQLIEDKGEETFQNLQDRIADTVGGWLEDLITGAKTFNDLLSAMGRSILHYFVDIVAKQIASSIASSVATAQKTIQGFGQTAGGVLNGVIGLLKGLGPGGWVVAGLAAIATLATVFGPKAPEVTYNPVEGYSPGTEAEVSRTVQRQAVAPVSVVFAAGAIQIVNPNRIEDIVDQVGRALARRLEDEDILFGVGPA